MAGPVSSPVPSWDSQCELLDEEEGTKYDAGPHGSKKENGRLTGSRGSPNGSTRSRASAHEQEAAPVAAAVYPWQPEGEGEEEEDDEDDEEVAARFRERASPSNSPSSAHSPTTLPSVVASVHKLPTSISAPELKPTVRSDQLPRFAVAAGQRSRAPSIHRIEQLSSKGYVPPRRSRVNNAGGGSAASMRSDATAAGRTRIGLLARDPHLIDKLAGAAGVRSRG